MEEIRCFLMDYGKIYNILGITIKTIKKTSESQKFSVSDLANGTYLLSVSTSRGESTEKLIVN